MKSKEIDIKPIRNMSNPETRAFWEAVERRVAAFNKRAPHWLYCASCTECDRRQLEGKV